MTTSEVDRPAIADRVSRELRNAREVLENTIELPSNVLVLILDLVQAAVRVLDQMIDQTDDLDRVLQDWGLAVDRVLAIHGHEETPSPRVGPVLDTPVVPTTTVGGPSDIDPSSDVGESAGAAHQPAPALAEGGENA